MLRYFIELEHLTTIHFLDPVKFQAVRALINEGSAYTVAQDPSTGKLGVQIAQSLWEACTGGVGGSYSCTVRQDVSRAQIRNAYAVHSMATGIGTTNVTASRDWITSNLLGTSEFSRYTHTHAHIPAMHFFYV